MKKVLNGLGCVTVGGILAILTWSLITALFELEGADRAHIAGAVSLFVWIPIPVYLIHTVCVRLAYKNRVDTNSYQPLYRPVALVTNLALQCIPMCLYWNTFRNTAQASVGFLAALILVCLFGLASLVAALVVGRPLPGKTRFPGFRADQ